LAVLGVSHRRVLVGRRYVEVYETKFELTKKLMYPGRKGAKEYL